MMQRFTYGNKYCALEHTTNKKNQAVFYSLLLEKKKAALSLHEKQEFSSFDAVKEYASIQQHLFLIINNQQVLSKKVIFTYDNPLKVVQKAFPTIKLSDFYYEVTVNQTASFVAICRKEFIDALIEEYLQNNTKILGFSLGNLAIQQLIPFLDDAQISSSNALLTIKDKQLINIEKIVATNQNYIINNLEISNKELLSLGGIISYVMQQENIQTNFTDKVKALQQNFKQQKIFKISSKIGLGILFVAVLINFFIFSNYRTAIGQLNNDLTLNDTYKNQLLRLQNRVTKKEKLVESVLAVSSSKVSRYIDEIGYSVPKTLSLTDLYYQPLKSTVKKGKEIPYQKNEILVKGISKNDTHFTHWIALLEKKEWIQQINILNYGKGKKTVTSFEFLIQTRNE